MSSKPGPERAEPFRLFAALGPSDVVTVARSMAAGNNDFINETSIPFSVQMLEFLRASKIEATVTSSHQSVATYQWENIRIETVPSKLFGAPGILYYIRGLGYAIRLALRARRARADLALLDSGTAPYFMLAVFKAMGIRVAVNMHNVRWPAGHPPTKTKDRLMRAADSWAIRNIIDGGIGCSPECERQFLADGTSAPFFQWRAQFRAEGFPLGFRRKDDEFGILFVGRIEEAKGVFDLIEIAKILQSRLRRSFRIDVCGHGSTFAAFTDAVDRGGVANIIRVHGQLNRTELYAQYQAADVMIVPTKTVIGEGMPMVCAEAALAGLPIVTSRVSSALDVLSDAILEAVPDDPASYAEALLLIAADDALHRRLSEAGRKQATQFLDRSFSYAAAVDRLLQALVPGHAQLQNHAALFEQSN